MTYHVEAKIPGFRIWCLWLNFSPSDHLLNFPPSYEKARIPMELASFSLSTASSNNLKWKSSSNLWTISVIIWLFPHKERWNGAIICNVHIWIGENSTKVLLVGDKTCPILVPSFRLAYLLEISIRSRFQGMYVLTVPVSAALSHLASPGWLYA